MYVCENVNLDSYKYNIIFINKKNNIIQRLMFVKV